LVIEGERPEGLLYEPNFVSADEAADLVGLLESLEFEEVKMRGQTARRTVRHFGLAYDYEGWKLTPGEPLPPSLEWLREPLRRYSLTFRTLKSS
jgi:alkylated DNA repair protein (DNA oxidative demethylase)